MTFVYMVRNLNNKLYIGISDNPERRLSQHNQNDGAYFTADGKYKIVFLEEYKNIQQARVREIQLKKWRREKKEMLIGRYSKGVSTKLN